MNILESLLEKESPINMEEFLSIKNSEMNLEIRKKTIQFIFKLYNKFFLRIETYHIAVCLLDRLLCKTEIHLDKMELTAVGCLSVASKYEEIYSPDSEDFVRKSISISDIMKVERIISKKLNFNFFYPSSHHFCCLFLKTVENPLLKNLVTYLNCLGTLLFTEYPPSLIAVSILAMTFHKLSIPFDSDTFFVRYPSQKIELVISELEEILCDPIIKPFQLHFEKPKYLGASNYF